MVTESNFLASDFEASQLAEIKHVWYFQPILEHILFHMSCVSNNAHISVVSVVIGINLKSGSIILSRLVYDAQFSFVTIYNTIILL